MKTLIKTTLLIIITAIAFTSCKKSQKTAPVGALGPNYPYLLNTIITPAILDTLEKHGVIVHAGLSPATVNGIYLVHPNVCTFDDSGYGEAGNTFDDVEFQFTAQNNSNFSISENYKDVGGGNEFGSDNSATFISGTGNLFTVFAQEVGSSDNISFKSIYVISGQFDGSAGIVNLQWSFYMESKGDDPANTLVPVHTTRVFVDGDNISQPQSTFSIDPSKIQSIIGGNIKRCLSAPKIKN